jgi:hypothetical protein
MYDMSQATAFWIVSALIFPLSQVSNTGVTVTNSQVQCTVLKTRVMGHAAAQVVYQYTQGSCDMIVVCAGW